MCRVTTFDPVREVRAVFVHRDGVYVQSLPVGTPTPEGYIASGYGVYERRGPEIRWISDHDTLEEARAALGTE